MSIHVDSQLKQRATPGMMKAQRKKIALCLEYPLALRGGVPVLVEILLCGLKDRYELALVSPDTKESLAGLPAAPFIASHFAWDPGNVTRDSSQKLARQLVESGIQLAHFHMGGPFGWGNRFLGRCPIPYLDRAGVATLSTVHLAPKLLEGYCGPQKPLWFKLALLPVAWTGKLDALRHLKREIAVSQRDERKLREWYWPLSGRFMHIYHSRLSAGAETPNSVVREPVILNVGHVARRKGQHLLTRAFAKIAKKFPEWKLAIIGDILEEECAREIQEIAKQNNLEQRIQLLGRRSDAMDFMRKASIFVQPSFFEGLPLALQEAMFCGCACVGTKISGNVELIDDQENGLLVEAGNADAMATALERLMTDTRLRETFGRKAPEVIDKKGMTAEKMLQKHVELYESILRDK